MLHTEKKLHQQQGTSILEITIGLTIYITLMILCCNVILYKQDELEAKNIALEFNQVIRAATNYALNEYHNVYDANKKEREQAHKILLEDLIQKNYLPQNFPLQNAYQQKYTIIFNATLKKIDVYIATKNGKQFPRKIKMHINKYINYFSNMLGDIKQTTDIKRPLKTILASGIQDDYNLLILNSLEINHSQDHLFRELYVDKLYLNQMNTDLSLEQHTIKGTNSKNSSYKISNSILEYNNNEFKQKLLKNINNIDPNIDKKISSSSKLDNNWLNIPILYIPADQNIQSIYQKEKLTYKKAVKDPYTKIANYICNYGLKNGDNLAQYVGRMFGITDNNNAYFYICYKKEKNEKQTYAQLLFEGENKYEDKNAINYKATIKLIKQIHIKSNYLNGSYVMDRENINKKYYLFLIEIYKRIHILREIFKKNNSEKQILKGDNILNNIFESISKILCNLNDKMVGIIKKSKDGNTLLNKNLLNPKNIIDNNLNDSDGFDDESNLLDIINIISSTSKIDNISNFINELQFSPRKAVSSSQTIDIYLAAAWKFYLSNFIYPNPKDKIEKLCKLKTTGSLLYAEIRYLLDFYKNKQNKQNKALKLIQDFFIILNEITNKTYFDTLQKNITLISILEYLNDYLACNSVNLNDKNKFIKLLYEEYNKFDDQNSYESFLSSEINQDIDDNASDQYQQNALEDSQISESNMNADNSYYNVKEQKSPRDIQISTNIESDLPIIFPLKKDPVSGYLQLDNKYKNYLKLAYKHDYFYNIKNNHSLFNECYNTIFEKLKQDEDNFLVVINAAVINFDFSEEIQQLNDSKLIRGSLKKLFDQLSSIFQNSLADSERNKLIETKIEKLQDKNIENLVCFLKKLQKINFKISKEILDKVTNTSENYVTDEILTEVIDYNKGLIRALWFDPINKRLYK